jgi:FkbM family methyltransferase
MKSRLPGTRCIAFEANPSNYETIRKQRDFTSLGVEYRHAAVAASTGNVEFLMLTKWPDGGELPVITPDNSLNRRSLEGGEYEKVSVPSVALGQMLAVNDFVADDFCLWIDAEGASREVLLGAEPILGRVGAILVEVEDYAHWRDQWLSGDVLDFLVDREFFSVARDYEYDTQYNVVYLHRRYLAHHGYGRHLRHPLPTCAGRTAARRGSARSRPARHREPRSCRVPSGRYRTSVAG